MKSFEKTILGILLLALCALLGGCSVDSPRDTSIPWSRPADWEGEIPGMNNGNGVR